MERWGWCLHEAFTPSSRSLGARRYSAGYLKRNLKANPATKHLITICPACRRGAYFFRATERTTGNTFCSLVHFWSGKSHIQALSSADISILDKKYENGQIPWSCSLLTPTPSKHVLLVLHATCELHEDLHSSSHSLSLYGIFHPLRKPNYASDSRKVLIFIRTKLMYSEFMGKMGDKKILKPW